MKKILVILGPTATGKTDLGLNLAQKFNGELVACDSRQVYEGLNIGTGKEPGKKDSRLKINDLRIKKEKGYWEINDVKIWMYDMADPKTQYTVVDYVKDAWKVIEDIWQRGKLPIIVGGTGLYLKALLEGLPNLNIPINPKLREELANLSKEKLQQKLQELSFEKWESLNESDRQNPRRLLRSIELHSMNPYTDKCKELNVSCHKHNVLKIGLTAQREILNQRIDLRVIFRINQGMIEETKKLHQQGLSFLRMRQLGLEYGNLADLLEGKVTKVEFIKKLQTKIHQYAKRQLTWFKKEKNINWFDITKPELALKVAKLINSWYYKKDI